MVLLSKLYCYQMEQEKATVVNEVYTLPVWTSIKHSHIGQPSAPHLYPSEHDFGQVKAAGHVTDVVVCISFTVSTPTTGKK